MAASTTCFTGVCCDDLGQRASEVLEHDDGLGAGVLQLMFQFARVYSGLTFTTTQFGTQHRGDRHRVLQHVGHHQRHARAEPARAPAARHPTTRHLVELRKAQSTVHADPRRMNAHAGTPLQHLTERPVARGVDPRPNTGRIARQARGDSAGVVGEGRRPHGAGSRMLRCSRRRRRRYGSCPNARLRRAPAPPLEKRGGQRTLARRRRWKKSCAPRPWR